MDFTDEELETLFRVTGPDSEYYEDVILIRTRILDEIEKRQELANMDFNECEGGACKL